MSELPDRIKIDITAAVKGFQQLFDGLRLYFEGISKIWKVWFPVVSQAHRAHVKAVRTDYHRKQKARRRRNRKR